MTLQDEETAGNDAIEEPLKFTCEACGSHELDMCLGGRIGCAVVESISYRLEDYETEEDEEEEIEIADAHVSVQTRPDGSEAWFWGVDNQDDAYSWFRCAECTHSLRFEDGSPVEDDTDLARWLILANKKSKQDEPR